MSTTEIRVAQPHRWPPNPHERRVAHVAYLLATLRMIADGQDDPAWMRLTARKAIAEVTA